MRDPICSTCRMPASEAGTLCHIGEHAYNPAMPTLECKRCWAEGVMEQESLRAIREDAELWADHLAECSFCYHRKGLIPRGLLFQACCAERRKQEARRVA